MNSAMKFFLAGCVAELYLLLIRRFYINADSEIQRIAWYDSYLWILTGVGAVILAAGLLCACLWRADSKKRLIGWALTGAGIYAAAVPALVRWNMSSMTLLMVLVPALILLGILWTLYDRECALALTILGVSLIVVWVCRRAFSSSVVGLYVKIAAVAYLALLAALAIQVKRKKLGKLFPTDADPLPVYMACGLSLAAILISMISATVAYYAMWTMAIIVFGLAVYYTVKQL